MSPVEAKRSREKAEDGYEKEQMNQEPSICKNNYGSESIILKTMTKRRDLNVPDAIGIPLNIKPMAKLLSEKMARLHLLFPGISTTKVDWETMGDELSEPQTSPYDKIIGDGPPHSIGNGSEVQ